MLFAGSIALTAIMWIAGLPFFFLFLFIPLIPFIGGKRIVKKCPECGWSTTGNEIFCPYDGIELEEDRKGIR